MAKMNAIGIDLGTTSCCVGVFVNGEVKIIANDHGMLFKFFFVDSNFFWTQFYFSGNLTTPSYVAFTDTECLVGEAAKSQIAANPLNTVFGIIFLFGILNTNFEY